MKAYRMRAYPTTGQQQRATRMLGVHCDIYNACLEERIKAYKMCGVSVSYAMQSAQLCDVRAVDPRAAKFSFSAEQRTVKRVDRTFKAFFARCKRGDTPGFPRFKPWQRFDTVEHTHGDGSKWVPTEGRWARAYFQGVGHLNVDEHTAIVGKVKTLSLVRDGRKWFVVAIAETPDIALPATGSTVGIDVGIARFLTTSNGEIVANPRFLKNASDELAHLQRRYAESGRRSKQLRRAIRKLHAKIKNQRLDFHHQTARRLVNQHDVIVLEDLNVRAMSQRAKVKPDPNNPDVFLPNGQAAKSGLNKSISDVGWSQFRTILNLKAASAGRRVEFVNPAYTSILCSHCAKRCTRPEQSTVICPTHGPIDADLNGAINILGRGLASSDAA